MTDLNAAKNQFERWYAETIPHMDFGSHKAMIKFAYEAGERDRSLGDEQIIDEQDAAIKRLTAKVDRLQERDKRFGTAARETVYALDGLDETWRLNDQHPYGRGVSNWDGPALLRGLLAEDGVLIPRPPDNEVKNG